MRRRSATLAARSKRRSTGSRSKRRHRTTERSVSRTGGTSAPGVEAPRSMERFAHRRIIVTGAASGIGRATVLRLLEEGGTVHGVDVVEDGLADTASLAAKADASGTFTSGVVDVSDEQSVR